MGRVPETTYDETALYEADHLPTVAACRDLLEQSGYDEAAQTGGKLAWPDEVLGILRTAFDRDVQAVDRSSGG